MEVGMKMTVKPSTRTQKEVTTDCRNNVLKSFILPVKKIQKIKRLSSINPLQRADQQVDFEFEKIILPKIQEAIHFMTARNNANTPHSLSIIENLPNSKLQKDFVIKNSITNDDWIRFYVKFANGFAEGCYSFFYYTFEDNFATHYHLGEVYWSKKDVKK